MKKLLFFVMMAMALSACNTIHGLGKDIESGGEAIQQSTK